MDDVVAGESGRRTERTVGVDDGVVVGQGVAVVAEGERLARRHVVAVAEGDVVVAGEGEGDAGIALGRRGRVVGRGSAREAQQGLAGHTVVAEEGSGVALVGHQQVVRSEEHTSELQSLIRISSAVFCLNKKKYILQSPHIKLTYETL